MMWVYLKSWYVAGCLRLTQDATSLRFPSAAGCGPYRPNTSPSPPQESPLLCKIVTGNFFTVAGDMLAQLGTRSCGGGGHGGDASSSSGSPKRSVDWMRTLRLCVETSAVGTPLGHWW